jgi:hypothetical protein
VHSEFKVALCLIVCLMQAFVTQNVLVQIGYSYFKACLGYIGRLCLKQA